MFETADMSRLTVAAPVGKLEDVLRTCASLGCVHIEEYGNFEDGMELVNQSVPIIQAISASY